MKFEMLYPEVANLHGDNHNIVYLGRCRPDATIVRTGLTDVPAFATGPVDLVYLGPLTERGQLIAVKHLLPYKERIAELIEQGTVFLFTHNAWEVLGERIHNVSQGYDEPGLGLFPMTSQIDLLQRYNGKVMGQVNGSTVVGYKSQFSMVEASDTLPGFLLAESGIGRNRATRVEGVRHHNFIGTSLLGPLLVMNPLFTKELLRLIDPDSEPVLAFEDLALQAYEARLAQFREPSRWHPWEQPAAIR